MSAKEQETYVHADFVPVKTVHHETIGTVRLIEHQEVVLIPTPSPDPRGVFPSNHSENIC
jgi:hypothetical protein